jgi:hypothetical protein
MADPVIPTQEQVLEYIKSLDPSKARAFFRALIEGSSEAREAIKSVTDKAKGLGSVVEDAVKGFENFKQYLVEIGLDLSFKQLGNAIKSGDSELIKLLTNVGLLGVGISGISTASLDAMGESASGTTEKLQNTLAVLNQFGFDFPKGGMMDNLLSSADKAKAFESAILASAAANGEYGQLLSEVGDDFSNLEDKMVSMIDATLQVANASGLTTTEVSKMQAGLNKIQGALSTNFDSLGGVNGKTSMFEATLRLATGSGIKFEEAVNDLDFAFQNYNTTGEKALTFIARMSEVSKDIGLPLKNVKDFTKSAGEGFKFFGDNSQSVLNILGKFGPALKESGLGPKAIQELTQNMIGNIGQLNTASRAFISSTSGGPGGLRGSAQIELLKTQGRLDEVQQMVEKSLRQQFGGKIVTLEDAAKSDSAAAQYEKQKQLLMSGPAKIASSEGEARAIIDAMAKGKTASIVGKEETAKEGDKALTTFLDAGNQIQERNYNELVVHSNYLDTLVQLNSVNANKDIRKILGQGSPFEDQGRRDRFKTESAENQFIVGKSGARQQNLNQYVASKGADIFSSMSEDKEKYKNIFSSFVESAKTEAKNKLGNIKNEIMTRPESSFNKVSDGISKSASNLETQGKTALNNAASVLTIQTDGFCPDCQKKQMKNVAEVVFDGKFKEVTGSGVKHIHNGASL